MSHNYLTTQGDRYTVARQLTDHGEPINLKGRDVTFVARHESGDKIVDALAEVVTPSQGRVLYQMSPTETALAGRYHLEWVVSGGSDDPTTFPFSDPAILSVREDVEQDDAVAKPLPEDRTVDALFANELNGSVTGDQPVTTLAGANLSIANGALDSTDTDTQRTDEEIEDVVNALLAAGANISLTYDDAGNSLTIAVSGSIDADTLDGIDSTQFARTDVAETFDAGVTLGTALSFADQDGDGVGFKLSENGTSGDLILEENSGFADLIAFSTDGTVNVPSGPLQEAGSRVSTRTYVDNSVRTNEEIRDVSGAMATDGLVHDDTADTLGLDVVATGSATLSSGAATVDTGVATTQAATFEVALGPATDDADIGAEIRSDSTSGTYQVDLVESPDTAVGNPSVEYDIIRVR